MKALRYILCGLVIAAAAGLIAYQYFVEKHLDASDISKALLVICGAVLSMLRPRKYKAVNKKAVYQKAYSELIQNAFYDEPKLEKRFYEAVHDYNQDKPSAAIAKLEKLRKECNRSNDLRAVTIFTALCLDDMQLYEKAITQYDAALSIRPCTTLHSNKGRCFMKMGRFEEAEACYKSAIHTDPQNAVAYNNLSALYFRQGGYEEALDLAQQALEIDANQPQALNTAAICSALLGNPADYETYYRRAVSSGSDGSKIKALIHQLDPEL